VGCIFCYFNASIFKGRRKKQDSLVSEKEREKTKREVGVVFTTGKKLF
jgi:hypothetical protein